jgi:hypothetical protein
MRVDNEEGDEAKHMPMPWYSWRNAILVGMCGAGVWAESWVVDPWNLHGRTGGSPPRRLVYLAPACCYRAVLTAEVGGNGCLSLTVTAAYVLATVAERLETLPRLWLVPHLHPTALATGALLWNRENSLVPVKTYNNSLVAIKNYSIP